MERKELEVYSEASNYAVVRMPGRNFPGCVVQGDTLFALLCVADRLHQLALAAGDEELIEEAAELVEGLADRLDHYEAVLKEHGFAIPYNRPARPSPE
jgi:hypothetical protein